MNLQELKKEAINKMIEDATNELINHYKFEELNLLKRNIEEFNFSNFNNDVAWEIANQFTPTYYSDIYEIFNDNASEIDESYEEMKNEIGSENSGDSISDCIKKGIFWNIYRELYYYDFNDLQNDFVDKKIKELKDVLIQQAIEIDDSINCYNDIDEIIEDLEDLEDFKNMVLNRKLEKKLKIKEIKTKIVKL